MLTRRSQRRKHFLIQKNQGSLTSSPLLSGKQAEQKIKSAFPKERWPSGKVIFSHCHIASKGPSPRGAKWRKINTFSGILCQILNPYSCKTSAGSRSVYCSCFNWSRGINAALISFADFNELSLSVGQELGLVLGDGFILFSVYSRPISRPCKFSPECLPRALVQVNGETLVLVELGMDHLRISALLWCPCKTLTSVKAMKPSIPAWSDLCMPPRQGFTFFLVWSAGKNHFHFTNNMLMRSITYRSGEREKPLFLTAYLCCGMFWLLSPDLCWQGSRSVSGSTTSEKRLLSQHLSCGTARLVCRQVSEQHTDVNWSL